MTFLFLRLRGGAKKRKKKNYTTPKKIKHKHRKVKLAVLKYYKVDDNGKINRLRRECPAEECGAGVFMAAHFDRQVRGLLSNLLSRVFNLETTSYLLLFAVLRQVRPYLCVQQARGQIDVYTPREAAPVHCLTSFCTANLECIISGQWHPFQSSVGCRFLWAYCLIVHLPLCFGDVKTTKRACGCRVSSLVVTRVCP